MKQSDVLRVLADPIAQELLGSAIPARLAYIGTDGFPRAIPMGFEWTGEAIVVCTSPTAPKVRAIESNPRVALTIDTEAQPPHVLLVRGTARIDVVDGVAPEYLAGSRRLIQSDRWAAFEAEVRATYRQMARISIVPVWAKVLDFERRIPDFLADLARQRERAR
jgi:hypothetical protein